MAKVTFNNKNAVFFQALKADVEAYFKTNGIKKTGNIKLYAKSVVLLLLAIGLYVGLLIMPAGFFPGVPMALLLGFTLAGIGFNIMHDACHGSYSSKGWVNNLLGLTLNALGGNAFIWKQKHNIIHHTYTNVDGIDDDIAKSPLLRQCHTQAWKPMHKAQHIYIWVVYALSSFLWVFLMDPIKYFQKKIYTTELSNMNATEHIIFWLTKVLYIVFYVAIPVMVVGWQAWAVGFACMHVAMGLALSVVFQLAHVVEETEFVPVAQNHLLIENEWAVHQIKTTANFSMHSKFISWYVGGLIFK